MINHYLLNSLFTLFLTQTYSFLTVNFKFTIEFLQTLIFFIVYSFLIIYIITIILVVFLIVFIIISNCSITLIFTFQANNLIHINHFKIKINQIKEII